MLAFARTPDRVRTTTSRRYARAHPKDGPRLTCLDENTILRLGEGLLTQAESDCVDEHLDRCSSCRTLLADIEKLGDADPGPATVVPGTVVGRYRVRHWIGSGNMSAVYLAFDPTLDRNVALKFIQQRFDAGWARKQQHQEGHALAKLNHPNVLTVHEIGEHRGRVYLATELIEGRTLREWLRTDEPTLETRLEVLRQAAVGLAAAHEHGIVHRDFKPDNVMVTRSGRAVVMDFGFASVDAAAAERRLATPWPAAGEEAAKTTAAGRVIAGTPAYMAPEQLAGDPADPRSDQFAFCAVAWETLTGVAAPTRTADPRISVREASKRRPIASALESVLRRGLKERPDRRYDSMNELIAAFDRACTPRKTGRLAVVATVAATVTAAVAYRTLAPESGPCDSDAQTASAVLAPWQGDADSVIVSDDRVATRLARYTEEWSQSREYSCQQASDRAQKDAAAACLEFHRRRLEVALQTIESEAPDPHQALAVVARLPSPNQCRDPAAAGDRLPADPAEAGRVVALRERLFEARLLGVIGETSRALAIADDTILRAVDVPGAPLLEARLVAAKLRAQTDFASVEPILGELVNEAALAGDEALRAEAYAILAMNRLRTRRIDAAETDIAATVAILDRIGANEELRARAHMVRAGIASVRMDFALADRELDRAVELWGHNDEALAITALYNRAINQHYRARMQPSAAAFERTLEGFERARDAQSGLYGPDHASVGRSWHSIGLVLLSLDRHEQALDAFERAFAIAQRTGGNIEQTVAMLGQAEALRGLKRWEEGIAAYEECLRLSALERQSCNYGKGVCLAALERLPEASQALRAAYELSVTDDVSVPRTRAISAFDLAQVLARQGQLGQARELAEEALRRAQGDEQAREILAEVRSWLADNPRVANAR